MANNLCNLSKQSTTGKNDGVVLNINSVSQIPLTTGGFQLRTFCTAEKIKFFITDFFGKCDQTRRKLRIWGQLLKKPLTENFNCCAVLHTT